MMETKHIDKDINLFYVTATSFPDGVMAAHQKIYDLAPPDEDRKFYGLSRPENGAIVYKAAAEELAPGEGAGINCDTIVLKKGAYYTRTIKNFMKQVQAIGQTFLEMTSQPDVDPEGYCVEYYLNDDDMECMVRKAD